MTSVTRRCFLQSALVSSVALASDSGTYRWWEESKADPIRIAIVGLGPIGLQQIDIFSALPTAKIVALCDPNTHRLRSAAEHLRTSGKGSPELTTQLASVLNDPTVEAVSIASAFPGRFVPLNEVLLSKKAVLFDTPCATSFSDAVSTMRLIGTSKTVFRCQLMNRLALDAEHLFPNAPSLRLIGTPLEALITSAKPTSNQRLLSVPAMACMNLLLSCTLEKKDIVAVCGDRESLPSRVPSTRGLKSIAFPTNRSFLKRIQINPLGSQISQTSLELRGQRGRVICHASDQVDSETQRRNLSDFLATVQLSSPENQITQQVYLAAGLLRLAEEPIPSGCTV